MLIFRTITGLRILQAFSKYQTVNDAVGLVVHSCLLVPYYSWCVADTQQVTPACIACLIVALDPIRGIGEL